MRFMKPAFTVFALSASLLVCASVAQAQASRTWVSGVGDDANPCSRTAPCKTFPGAISKTAAGGEINALDPGSFGAVTITKAITISGEVGTAGVLFAGTNGIVVNAPAGTVVTLRGLDLNGFGTGLNGIRFLAGGTLIVENCLIQNGTQKGIDFEPSSNSHLIVRNTTIHNFGNTPNGGAVFIKPGVAGTAKVTLDNVTMTRSLFGLRAENGSTVAVRNSVASNNLNNGFLAFTSGAGAVEMSIDGTLVSANGINGIRSEGSASAIIRISDNVITGNNPGLSTATGGQIISYGNNRNTGNVGNNNGAPSSTVGEQ